MNKKIISLILLLCMVFSLLPAGAMAVEPDQTEAADEPLTDESASVQPAAEESEELIAGELTEDDQSAYNAFDSYVDKLISTDAELDSTGNAIAGNLLTGNAKTAYDTIAPQLSTIAQYGGSVQFRFKSNGNALTSQEARDILHALTSDYPLELYWHGLRYFYGNGIFKFTVAEDFRGADEFTVDPNEAYAAYSTIENAAGNAANILNSARSLSTDLDRLVYFKEAICSLVSYNKPAAASTSSRYGHPWQMIWVFDNDSSTEVVCEGYSKAFQYLCDKTFTNGQVQCYSVNGKTSGNHMWNVVSFKGKNYLVDVTNCDGGNGSFTAGYPFRLFMAGASGSPSGGYTVSRPKVFTEVNSDGKYRYLNEGQTTYYYDDNLVWGGSSFLRLSSSSYPIFYNITQNKLARGHSYSWRPNASDNFSFSIAANTKSFKLPDGASLSADGTITYTPKNITGPQSFTLKAVYSGYGGYTSTYYCTVNLPEVVEGSPDDPGELVCDPPTGLTASYGSSLSGVTLRNPSGNTPGKWSWVNGSQTVGNVGTNRFKAIFTPEDSNFDPVTVELTVKVSARSLSGAAVTLSQTSYEYDGTAKCPKATVKLSSVILTEGTDYTVSYINNINAGTATVIITGKGNYSGTKNVNFTIGERTDCSITVTALESSEYDYAYVEVNKESFDGLVKNASESNADKATINVRASESIKTVDVDLPVSSIRNMYLKSNADLVITMPKASITFPHKALYSLSSKGEYFTIFFFDLGSGGYSVGFTVDGEDLDSVNLDAKLAINLTDPSAGCTAQYIDSNGIEHVIRKSVVKDGAMIIPIKNSSILPILQLVDNSKTFSDTRGHWAKNAVDFVSSHKLFQGTSDRDFSPDLTMTRAMMVTVLHRLEDEPAGGKSSFSDVPKNTWYYNSIAWAANKGIIENSTGKYYPDDVVPREEMALLFYRYAKAMGYDTSASASLSGFKDASQISSSAARQALSWAVGVGLMNGISETVLGPNSSATRAQVATMFQRLCELVLNP